MRCLIALVIVGLSSAALARAPSPAAIPLSRPDPAWQTRVDQMHKQVRRARGKARVVLLGDSIIYGWKFVGRPVWKRRFASLEALNLGVDRDETGHVLWRIQHGNLEGLNPAVLVLLAGTNNVGRRDHSARQIADGIQAVVGEIRQRLPDTRVLLVGLLPGRRHPAPRREKIRRINRRIARLADGAAVTYLDLTARLLDAQGDLPARISPDGVHLTEAGYALWAEGMAGVLDELLAPSPR